MAVTHNKQGTHDVPGSSPVGLCGARRSQNTAADVYRQHVVFILQLQIIIRTLFLCWVCSCFCVKTVLTHILSPQTSCQRMKSSHTPLHVDAVCVFCHMYVWEVCGGVGRWVPQSSPSSGVCWWLTAKAEGREDRQYRVMRDALNRLGHAAQPTRHVSSTLQRFLSHVTCQTWRGSEVEN